MIVWDFFKKILDGQSITDAVHEQYRAHVEATEAAKPKESQETMQTFQLNSPNSAQTSSNFTATSPSAIGNRSVTGAAAVTSSPAIPNRSRAAGATTAINISPEIATNSATPSPSSSRRTSISSNSAPASRSGSVSSKLDAEQDINMEATIKRILDEALKKEREKLAEEQKKQFDQQKELATRLATIQEENTQLRTDQIKLKDEAANRQKELDLNLSKMKEEAEAILKAEKAANETKLKEEATAAEEKLKAALQKERAAYEAKLQADAAALNEKLLAMAKEKMADLERERMEEERQAQQKQAVAATAVNLASNPSTNNPDGKAYSEQAKQRDKLIQALRAIISNPNTKIKPKPLPPAPNAANGFEYYMNEPFSTQEAWVSTLPPTKEQILSDIVNRAKDANDPFTITLDTIAQLVGINPKTLQDQNLQVEMQIDDLDNNLGVGSRTKRVLSSHNKDADEKKKADEHSLVCGLLKDKNPLSIHFSFDKYGRPKIADVVERDANEYMAPVAQNMGVTVVATNKKARVVGTARVQRK